MPFVWCEPCLAIMARITCPCTEINKRAQGRRACCLAKGQPRPIANGFMGMRDNDSNMRLKYKLDVVRFSDLLKKLGGSHE